jgi:hypothetical protein
VKWRSIAARLALAAVLTALPLGSTTVGAAGLPHAAPVAAATVHPVQAGLAHTATAPHAGAHDRGDGDDEDRGGHDRRDHDCHRHGGLVTLIVRLLFGFDEHC